MRQEANAAVEMEHWGNMAKFALHNDWRLVKQRQQKSQ